MQVAKSIATSNLAKFGDLLPIAALYEPGSFFLRKETLQKGLILRSFASDRVMSSSLINMELLANSKIAKLFTKEEIERGSFKMLFAKEEAAARCLKESMTKAGLTVPIYIALVEGSDRKISFGDYSN